MNLAPGRQVRTTHVADGFDRMAFTVSDIERMTEAGVLEPDDKFELIEGEIVWMQAKHFPHERPDHALTHAAAPGFSLRLSDL